MSINNRYKEQALQGRYITNAHITPILQNLSSKFEVSMIGYSVDLSPIYGVTVGHGAQRVLMWSQMHGNESTTTKALFDLFNYLEDQDTLLKACTLVVIPILNPDGADEFTRANAADIDLNRDAQRLSQPESKLLRMVFDSFKPDYCFNLHGQRTIFSAGDSNKPATLSFLSPAQDAGRAVTETRRKAMNIIVAMHKQLKSILPEQIGRYDDGFNLNCVGDTFQSLGVPTVLFEAGHYHNDYLREQTRSYVFEALKTALNYIAADLVTDTDSGYWDIPENQKLFYDVIIRNAMQDSKQVAIAIQYQEVFDGEAVDFVPKIEIIGRLNDRFGHKEIDAKQQNVLNADGNQIKEGEEVDFVRINNELFSLKLTNI
jgi:hypothetical protein